MTADIKDEAPKTLDELLKKIKWEDLTEQEHQLTDKYHEALGLDEVKKIMKLKEPKEEEAYGQAQDIYNGLAHFYAKISGYDLAKENKKTALTKARAEVKRLLNGLYEREGQSRKYGSNAGFRYAMDLIRSGKTLEVLEKLRSYSSGETERNWWNEHLEQVSKKDLTKTPHRKALAEMYQKVEGGDIADYIENIEQHLYGHAMQQRYNPKPAEKAPHH